MTFRVLGLLEIRHRGQWLHIGGERTRTLVSVLLLRANQTVDAQWLMRMIWPAGRPASADANLRQYVAKVRQVWRRHALDDVASLRSATPGYRLEVARDKLDLTTFADLTALGRSALAVHDLPAARDYLTRAVSLWRGELCAGLPCCPELQIEQAYWTELRLLATESLLTAQLALGDHGEATAQLQRLTAEHPLREELRGMLMLALYRSQRRGDALEVFGRTRSVLVAELGIEPGPYLQRLQRAILADDPSLVSEAAVINTPFTAAAPAHARVSI
jgi:DNA-binding SARP family transcriptional activator